MPAYDISTLQALVVDDNRHFLSIIRTMLRAFGMRQIYDCVDAASGFEALRHNDVDFALVDLHLNEIDGLEFTKLVRTASDSPNTRLPIIVVSAYSERSMVERAMNAGVDEFLVKPVSPDMVYKRICSVIERPWPYVRTGGYYGPDRRRRMETTYSGSERRASRSIVELGDVA